MLTLQATVLYSKEETQFIENIFVQRKGDERHQNIPTEVYVQTLNQSHQRDCEKKSILQIKSIWKCTAQRKRLGNVRKMLAKEELTLKAEKEERRLPLS